MNLLFTPGSSFSGGENEAHFARKLTDVGKDVGKMWGRIWGRCAKMWEKDMGKMWGRCGKGCGEDVEKDMGKMQGKLRKGKSLNPLLMRI